VYKSATVMILYLTNTILTLSLLSGCIDRHGGVGIHMI